LRYDIVHEAHRELSHLGIDKTLSHVKENFYFPKMRDFITKYINHCISYFYFKIPKKGTTYWHPLEKGDTPYHTIHIDHVGPFVVTERENKYVLTRVDGYSKYVVLRAVKDTTAEKTIVNVREFIYHYGRPIRIVSDRGTTSTFEKFCREHFIQHVKVTSNSPRSNGQVEIINEIMVRSLAMTTEENDNAD